MDIVGASAVSANERLKGGCMPEKNEDFQKNLTKVWEITQRQLDKMVKEATVLAKKSEVYLRDISGKGKIEAEILISKAKREKLYYDLGKTVAAVTGKNRKKKVELLQKELSGLNRNIKRNERLLKIKMSKKTQKSS